MNIFTEVNKGIIFLTFDGVFDNNSFNKFDKEINYLLYNQGISYYSFNFNNVGLNDDVVPNIQNKLVEIFLNCGKVAMCGLNKKYQNKIGRGKDNLYYVKDEREVSKYLSL